MELILCAALFALSCWLLVLLHRLISEWCASISNTYRKVKVWRPSVRGAHNITAYIVRATFTVTVYLLTLVGISALFWSPPFAFAVALPLFLAHVILEELE